MVLMNWLRSPMQKIREVHVSEIIKILKEGVKVVLTCRPGYFVSDSEIKKILSPIKRFTNELERTPPAVFRNRIEDRGAIRENLLTNLTLSGIGGDTPPPPFQVLGANVNLEGFNETDIYNYVKTNLNQHSNGQHYL